MDDGDGERNPLQSPLPVDYGLPLERNPLQSPLPTAIHPTSPIVNLMDEPPMDLPGDVHIPLIPVTPPNEPSLLGDNAKQQQ